MNIKGYFKFGCLAPHLQVISPTPLVEAALEKIPGASVLFVGRSLMTMLTYGKHDFFKMGNNDKQCVSIGIRLLPFFAPFPFRQSVISAKLCRSQLARIHWEICPLCPSRRSDGLGLVTIRGQGGHTYGSKADGNDRSWKFCKTNHLYLLFLFSIAFSVENDSNCFGSMFSHWFSTFSPCLPNISHVFPSFPKRFFFPCFPKIFFPCFPSRFFSCFPKRFLPCFPKRFSLPQKGFPMLSQKVFPPCFHKRFCPCFPMLSQKVFACFPKRFFQCFPKDCSHAFRKGFSHAFRKGFSHAFPKGFSHAFPKGFSHAFPKDFPHAFPKGFCQCFPMLSQKVLPMFPKRFFPCFPKVFFPCFPNGGLFFLFVFCVLGIFWISVSLLLCFAAFLLLSFLLFPASLLL